MAGGRLVSIQEAELLGVTTRSAEWQLSDDGIVMCGFWSIDVIDFAIGTFHLSVQYNTILSLTKVDVWRTARTRQKRI